MKRGLLVYRCRKCGELIKDIQIPDGVLAITRIMNNIELPNEWGGFIVKQTDIHICNDRNIGITDLIGFEKTNKQRKYEM